MTSTPLTIAVPNEGDGTHIQTQFGCQFPDGHTEWGSWNDHSGVSWSYESLIVMKEQNSMDRWAKTLRRRAEAASIQVSEYIEDHTFLKRTVILVTTAAEEL